MNKKGGDKHMKNKNIIIALVCVVIAGAGGFYGGMQYEKTKAPVAMNTLGGQFGQQGGGQFRQRGGFGGGQNANFRPVRGQVINSDDNSITVKLMDGSSKIVVVSGKTLYIKSDTVSKSDIKTGDTIMVVGAQNSDGSVTAQSVQVNPPQQMIRNQNRQGGIRVQNQ
jgi:hypothetical protein